ncbi:MAG TPA: hypothetical protein VFO16_02650 [Pseudonocardiaceae bacterium]|nr:hypothetical protein [Pseudonocardiaceae bacterium]
MTVSSVRKKDFTTILDIVHMMNDDQSEVEALRGALVQLGTLMSCESIYYIGVEHTTGRMLGNVVNTAGTDISQLPGFHTAFRQHPGFAAYRRGQLVPGSSAALTDLVDLPTLRRLAFYTDFQRPYDGDDQLLCIASVGNQRGTVLVFNHARLGFSGRSRAIADLVTPHLAQAVCVGDA